MFPKTEVLAVCRWFVVDGADMLWGHVASHIAHNLRARYQVNYDPGVHTGDFVIVVNAEDVWLTGRKRPTKLITGTPVG